MLQTAFPAVFLAVASDINAILHHDEPSSYPVFGLLMIKISMLVYIADRARASRPMSYLRALPFYSAFQEISEVAGDLLRSADNSKARYSSEEDFSETHMGQQLLQLKLALGLPTSLSDYPVDLYPRDQLPRGMLEVLAKPGGMLLRQVVMEHERSKAGEKKHQRFWGKTALVCCECGAGNSDPSTEEAQKFKTAGCCQIITLCSAACAKKNWTTHKKVCWTRRKS